MSLLQKMHVLDLIHQGEHQAFFSQAEDGAGTSLKWTLSLEAWADMDQPQQITITVVPGNLLEPPPEEPNEAG